MTDAPHPLGLTSHPEWQAVRARWCDLWLSQFVTSPSDIPMDDDHDDIPEEDFRPSVVTFVIALALVVGALLASILPTALN